MAKYKEREKKHERNQRRFLAYAISCDESFDRETFFGYFKENSRLIAKMPAEKVSEAIEAGLERLKNPKEKQILVLKYGLDGQLYMYCYEDLARIFNEYKWDIVKTKKEALKKMKPYLEAVVSLAEYH